MDEDTLVETYRELYSARFGETPPLRDGDILAARNRAIHELDQNAESALDDAVLDEMHWMV